MVSAGDGGGVTTPVTPAPKAGLIGVLTGTLGAPVIALLIEASGRPDARVIPVPNEYFGGNIGVIGLWW